jgi:hypothetical protein
MGIGAHIPDAMQNHNIGMFNANSNGPDTGAMTFIGGDSRGYNNNLTGILIPNGAGPLRLAMETRVASTSAYFCIKY